MFGSLIYNSNILVRDICEFFCMQVKLYEDFAKSQAKQEVDEVIEGEGAEDKQPPPPTHIFQVQCKLPCSF